ncbi:DAK2 domain-containing protein [Brotaphodocola sp.]|uniref:DAK2 domain-containing protein n=1 Tax=Brotaphodocola sp. TaxID=3073577 RepID=UPI003D7DA65E
MKDIDAHLLQRAFLSAAKGLEAKKEWINELNVFPVPDGDTGTNMTMTIMSAAREVAGIEQPTMENLAKAISSGSLRGARGNSGVILSQLLRGFTKEIKTVDKINVTVLANAFVRATETAYKAVMKPKEGTILTVAKGMADKAVELVPQTDDVIEFAEKVIEQGDYVLSQTPEMLPVLKQAGVVDSGGQGLMQVLKGALDGLNGKEVDMSIPASNGAGVSAMTAGKSAAGSSDIETADIKFGYCTEFIINLEKEYTEKDEHEFKAYLESLGDSIVVVSDDDVVKVHVHTNDPGLAIQKALTYGSLSRMKIDNMREEHHERLIQNAEKLAKEQKEQEDKEAQAKASEEPRKPAGFIAVSVGEGLSEIFRGIGADYIIEGGQTMNPSTEDMLSAIEKVNADVIYILPNNKNIILAAEQAKYLVEDKKIVVVPSRTVPQGITALINYIPDQTPEENLETMKDEMARVKTGQITYAVRNTNIDGMEIHEGDIMGIGDHGMLTVGTSIENVALDSLKAMADEESELVTIYYGSDVKEEDAQALLDKAKEAFPDLEIELQNGGQPIYYYMISVE